MTLTFVVCVSDQNVLDANLLASPCLCPDSPHQVIAVHGCRSAAEGFETGMALAAGEVVVLVHQDVYLPEEWDARFVSGFSEARRRFGAEVVGVYGLSPSDSEGRCSRLGIVKDRGEWLKEPGQLPARARSLDELLIALPRGSRLRPDPELGFDLYATDLVLQAEQRGGCGAVIEAPCEHRSSLPQRSVPEEIIARFRTSAAVFERKWAEKFPVETPCIRFDANVPASAQINELIIRTGGNG